MDAHKIRYADFFIKRYLRRDNRLLAYADDLRQEALLGILEAQRRFDAARSTKLETYEWMWMHVYVSKAIAKLVKRRHEFTPDVEPGEDAFIDTVPSEGPSPETQVQEHRDYAQFVNVELPKRVKTRFRPATQEKAMQIALARLKGATLREAAAEHGCTRERARQITAKLGIGD